MNTKQIGDISESKVISRLLEKGYSVSIPFGDSNRYDIVLDDGEKLQKVQVKTAKLDAKGQHVTFSCKSNNWNSGELYDYKDDVDLFIVYCPQNNKIYRVPIEEIGTSSFRIRVEEPKKNDYRINREEDYLL